MSVTVGVRKFRENLSHYLDLVKSGSETVVITERGRPVARLEGPSNYERMVAEGRIRPAKRPKRRIRMEDLIQIDGPPWPSEMIIEDRKRDRF